MENTILVTLGVVAFLLYHIWRNVRPRNFPPGPPCLPFFGSLPFIPWNVLSKNKPSISDYMNEAFGKVAGIYSPTRPIIFLSDADMLRRMFKMEEFSARPSNKPFHKNRFGSKDGSVRGLIFSSGNEWKEQRRFTLRSLKDLGFGKTSMEDSINEEVQKLVELLKKQPEGKPMSLISVMNLSIVNALWVLLTGEKLALDNPKLKDIAYRIDQLFRHNGRVNSFLRWLGPWAIEKFDPFYLFNKKLLTDMKNLLITYIKDHQQEYDQESEDKDYIDRYLREIRNASDPLSSFHGKRGEESLITSLVDLFAAGTETTTTTLMWSIFYLLHHPEVQENIIKELDSVMGDLKTVSFDDRSLLPYTCSVINEIHRHASIVRVGLPHSTTEDIHMDGYYFPKGSIIMGNLIQIHHDGAYWSKPHEFNPERFLNNGVCQTSINLMHFSVGKRYCLGQTLAEKEFFMFFVGLTKAFEFLPSKEDGLPGCGYQSGSHGGIIRVAPQYKVVLKHRR